MILVTVHKREKPKHFQASYECNLRAILTAVDYEDPIDTYEDVIR